MIHSNLSKSSAPFFPGHCIIVAPAASSSRFLCCPPLSSESEQAMSGFCDFFSLSIILHFRGVRSDESSTMGLGLGPSTNLVVREGLSANNVPIPTSMPSCTARRWCVITIDSFPLKARGSPLCTAIDPSRLCAYVSVTYGRRCLSASSLPSGAREQEVGADVAGDVSAGANTGFVNRSTKRSGSSMGIHAS